MDIEINGRTVSLNVKLPSFKEKKVESHGTDFAALLEEQNKAKSEILEKGFGKYVADMQQEKLEKEIREKILAALGLSEEQYKQLPASQRAAIEQAVQEAIQQEMQLRAQENNKEKGNSSLSVPMVAALSG